MSESSIRILLERLEELEKERLSWEKQWKDIADYIVPRRGSFVSQNEQPNDGGKRNNRKIFDGVATIGIDRLAAGIHSGLTSPARPWFRLALQDEEMSDLDDVRNWLTTTERIMYNALARSNFYDAVHEYFIELAAFGSSCMLCEPDKDMNPVFIVIPAGQYVLAPGLDGRVNTMYRRFYMQLRQILNKFGENSLSKDMRERFNKNPYDWEQVVHCILPNDDHNPFVTSVKDKPFTSLYFLYERNEGKFLRRSGYEELPFFASRWAINGDDVYGRGPGHMVLPHVKLLQEVTKSMLKAIHKMVDPPMNVPAGSKGRVNLYPGGINFYNGTTPEAIIPTYQIRFDVQSAQTTVLDLREQIRTGLYNDLFIMLTSGPQMTAREVQERHEEKMLMLGPVIERQGHELLDPIIARVMGILFRKGELPDVPEVLSGASLNIQYISSLAQAQRQIGTASIRSLTEYVGAVTQLFPEVTDRMDWDEIIVKYADMLGVPSSVLRGEDSVSEIRQARAEAQQASGNAEQMQGAVDTAEALGNIDMDKNSALKQMVNSSQEQ